MIELLEFKKDDFTRLISWIGNPKLLIQFAGTRFRFPLDEKQLTDHIKDTNRYSFKARWIEKDVIIGHAEIYHYEEDKGLIGRVIIGEQNLGGKGMGKQLLIELCKKGFNELNLKQLHLNVYDWNETAIQCYRKIGFSAIPFKKQNTIYKGEKWNVIRMKLEKCDFLENL